MFIGLQYARERYGFCGLGLTKFACSKLPGLEIAFFAIKTGDEIDWTNEDGVGSYQCKIAFFLKIMF